MSIPFLSQVSRYLRRLTTEPVLAELELQRLLLGQTRLHQLANVPPTRLAESEARVFSQSGEDGIIEKLIQHLPGIPESFVEFGVQDYREANTRFLLMNRNWRGLVLDGSAENVRAIQQQEIAWRHDFTARCAFITRENIGGLIASFTAPDELGLLSIDIDGNDYWVWEAIEARPWIVVCEYNSLFGPRGQFTVPYHADFERTRAHYSGIYFGASIEAFAALGARKGYVLLGSNAVATNLFFVRAELAAAFRPQTAAEAHVRIRTRQSRNEQGALNFLDYEASRRLLGELPVVELTTGREMPLNQAQEIAASG